METNSASNRETRQQIAHAVEQLELSQWPTAWKDLDALSSRTVVDGIEVDPEGVLLQADGHFQGTMNVYVLLQYDPGSEDSLETTESFAGHFTGYFKSDKRPEIDHVTVDTSPFYEGAPENKTSSW